VQSRRKEKNGRGGHISVVTVNHNLRTLRRALHLAVEWDVIAKVPKIKLLTGENQRDYVLTDEDVAAFSNESGLIYRLVPFRVDTGLRRSEAVNLEWTAVALQGNPPPSKL
jgi:integrase